MAILRSIIYGLLILEAVNSGLWIARLLPSLGVRGWTVIALVAARGLVSSVEIVSAVMLRMRRPSGPPLARMALLASAILMPLEIGFRLVPTSMDPTYRWWVAGAYWAYVAVVVRLLPR